MFITYKMEMAIPYSVLPKYSRKVMYGQVKADIREIIKKLCEYKEFQLLKAQYVQIMYTYV